MSFSPPQDYVEAVYVEFVQNARSSATVQQDLEQFEGRYGDLKTALGNMEWHSPDQAYFIRPVDGGHERVLRNVMPGQLATALERGFLPLSLAAYQATLPKTVVPQLEPDTEVRMDPGERSEEAEPPTEAVTCEECGRGFKNNAGLSSHLRRNPHEEQPSQIRGGSDEL